MPATAWRGDVETVRAWLSQPDIVQRVDAVEERLAAVGHVAFVPSAARYHLQDEFLAEPCAWFYDGENHENIFYGGAGGFHIDTLAWLYGPESMDLSTPPAMPMTRAFHFYGVLLTAIKENNVALMELLLASSTFCTVFDKETQRVVLEDGMSRIGGSGADVTISLLVAHGAEINCDDALPVYGSRDRATVSLLRHIEREGGQFVGIQRVLHRMLVDAASLRELLWLGVDLRDDAVVDLRGTANSGGCDQLEIIHVLLKEGLVDVDAQQNEGRFSDSGTALIRAVRGLFGLRVDGVDETVQIIELLLQHGADARLPDHRGLTALDYVKIATNDTVYSVLTRLLQRQ